MSLSCSSDNSEWKIVQDLFQRRRFDQLMKEIVEGDLMQITRIEHLQDLYETIAQLVDAIIQLTDDIFINFQQ